MWEKILVFGAVVLLAALVLGAAAFYANKRGDDPGFLLKMMGLVITMAMAGLAWGLYSDYLNRLGSEAKEKAQKNSIVVLVTKVGKVQGGMQTTDSGFIFSSSYTSFETDKGVYRVEGSHIIQKGADAELQLRGSGKEYLCVGGSGNCMRLSRN